MFYRHQTPAERAHSVVAWAALFSISPDLEADPLPDEPCFSCGEHECRCPVDCPLCEGTGVVPDFPPNGDPPFAAACPRCWGDRKVQKESD